MGRTKYWEEYDINGDTCTYKAISAKAVNIAECQNRI
jgi:hypothetical protein